MKILGIDYGEKRIGLAVSDESMTLARELTILSPKDFWSQIQLIIGENEITKIVIGWPLNMSAQETKKTEEVKAFKEKLGKLGNWEIAIMDERLSSQMAETISGIRLRQGSGGSRSNFKNKLKGAKNLDSLAAQILLQNYLDKMKS